MTNYYLSILFPLLLISFHSLSSQISPKPENKISNIPEMVWVEGGDFAMGGTKEQGSYSLSDELPVVKVKLDGFWLGKYEVTHAQYAEFLSESGNQMEGGKSWYKEDKYALIQRQKDSFFVAKAGFENYPVSNVSWYGARAYCDWLSQRTGQRFRLPTEAEWEYAARGGQNGKNYLYSGGNTAEEIVWSNEYAANSGTNWNFKKDKGIHPIGLKSPNELGIYDMSGNLSEWCADLYHNHLSGGQNPKGPAYGSKRVLRGGSWDNDVESARVSARNFSSPTSSFLVNKGFRVARGKDYSKLKADLESFASERDFNGTVLVKKQDEILFHQSFGLADRKQTIPNTNETTYAIASITKLFTSVLVLQLASEQKIKLDASINHYLKGYDYPEIGDKVSIHHLLTHTSGLENCEKKGRTNGVLPGIYTDESSMDELIKEYCSGPLVNEVGTVFDYNNGEYIILGKIIEEVCNKAFSEVLRERIIEPLGLKNTGLITQKADILPLARTYRWDRKESQYSRDIDRLYQNYFASGAMYSTTEDLMKFSDALFQGKLIGRQQMERLLRTYPESSSYGYGMWVNYYNYGRSVPQVAQRYGRIWGINTLISHFIEDDITVIVLANTNRVSVSEFQHLVGEYLFE